MSGVHTPGPWAYRPQEHDDWGIVRTTVVNEAGWRPIVARASYVDSPTDEELGAHRRNKTDPAEANARLIAAAPDLLAALIALTEATVEDCGDPDVVGVDVFDGKTCVDDGTVGWTKDGELATTFKMIRAARTAIAKATGQ